MAAGSHFGCPKITLYRISYHFRSIPQFLFCEIFHKMAAGGHFRCPKITFGRISGHSDQYETLLFLFLQNGQRRQFWMSEIHFRSHFWPFQINTQLYFLFEIFIFVKYFYKMAAGGHFGCPKITFGRISGHFRSIRNFFFFKFTNWLPSAILDVRNSLWITFSGHFRSIQIFLILYKMAAGGHFGCPKITFDLISGHFRSIRNLNLFFIFDKMAAIGHFGCPKFTLDHISGHFRSIQIFYLFFYFFYKMAAGGHFGCPKITFYRISDRCTTLIFLEIFDKMADVGHFGCPKFTFDRISGHFRSICNFNFFGFFFDKMAAGGHFGCPKFTFDRISGHFRSIGHFGFPKFTFDRNSGHFRSIQNFFPAAILDVWKSLWIAFLAISDWWAILDVRNSLSMAFLAISDPYGTFNFFFKFWTFWMSANNFRSHFWPFQINTQLLIFFNFWTNGWDDNVNYRTCPRYLDE